MENNLENNAMRKLLILLTPMLLTACINDSASYYIDGRDHALSVRRQQDYFWQDQANVTLMVSRLPDCQRLHTLAKAVAEDVKVEVFAAGDGLWNIRLGNRLWQAETNTCNSLVELQNDPKADLGQPVGAFVVQDDNKLVFVAAPDAPAGAAGTAPAQ